MPAPSGASVIRSSMPSAWDELASSNETGCASRRASAVNACAGILVEDRFAYSDDGLTHASRNHAAGSSFDFDAAYIHGVRHAGGPPATSIHCYSPPLWRMGHYDVDHQGALCRTSMTYLEEVAEGANA